MRVLLAYGFCGLGGVETTLLNRCAALRDSGIDTTVLFREFYGDGARSIADLAHVHVGLDRIGDLFSARFDAVCIVDYEEFLPVWRQFSPDSRLLLETHASITTRLIAFHRFADDQAVAGVIVPSEFNRDLLLKTSRGARPIFVVPNSVDTRTFTQVRHAGLLDRFGTLPEGPVFLWVGRLEDEKNPAGFLAFSRALALRRPDARFICIGDAPQDAAYAQRLRDSVPAGLGDRHTFIAAVPNSVMPMYYSLAAASGGCLVSTSRFESVPMKFLEAMACRCPVLSTDIGGVREILAPDVTGLLFDADDIESIVRAAESLSDVTLPFRTGLLDRAREFVTNNHSLPVTSARFREALAATVQ